MARYWPLCDRILQGLKPVTYSGPFTARLKPCPCYKALSFFTWVSFSAASLALREFVNLCSIRKNALVSGAQIESLYPTHPAQNADGWGTRLYLFNVNFDMN